MQPYFFPYAGYFRLFAAVDLFVALDCVQFPRRGWVHRNLVEDRDGEKQWLTLPLRKGDRDSTRIVDLEFQDDAESALRQQARRFPSLVALDKTAPELERRLFDLDVRPVDYLCNTLAWQAEVLGLARPIVRSSSLAIDDGLRAQDRIIEIARRVGATEYVNAPGGRQLYATEAFEKAGLALHFLAEYGGRFESMLQRLAGEDPAQIAAEVARFTSW